MAVISREAGIEITYEVKKKTLMNNIARLYQDSLADEIYLMAALLGICIIVITDWGESLYLVKISRVLIPIKYICKLLSQGHHGKSEVQIQEDIFQG